MGDRSSVLAGALAGALLLAACGSDSEPAATSSVPSTTSASSTSTEVAITPPEPGDVVDLRGADVVEIEVRDNVFDPKVFEVDPGTRIVFRNRGRNTHNVTPAVEGAFDPIPGDDLEADESGTLLISEPGHYPFFCSFHGTATAGQTGYVIVGEDPRVVE